jgi:putative acetyltransferase
MSVREISDLVIRTETAADYAMIREVNEAAFGGVEEADLIESLRIDGLVLLSAVAEVGARIVGHILFSRMSIETPTESSAAVALAPMAVVPGFQRQGIGGKLIRYGLNALRASGEKIVIVVGHPEYYPRFGFSAERARSLDNPFHSDAFMVLELSPRALADVRGHVRYPPPFGL